MSKFINAVITVPDCENDDGSPVTDVICLNMDRLDSVTVTFDEDDSMYSLNIYRQSQTECETYLIPEDADAEKIKAQLKGLSND